MDATALHLLPSRDLPVCFPGRPCLEFSPYQADLINAVTALGPASAAIAVGCFVVLGIALLLLAGGLRPRAVRTGPSPWLVVLSAMLVLIGAVAAAAVGVHQGAVDLIYGPQGGPPESLIASWPLVGLAGGTLTFLGFVALVVTAAVSSVRLRARGR